MHAHFSRGKQPEFPVHCIGTRKLSSLMSCNRNISPCWERTEHAAVAWSGCSIQVIIIIHTPTDFSRSRHKHGHGLFGISLNNSQSKTNRMFFGTTWRENVDRKHGNMWHNFSVQLLSLYSFWHAVLDFSSAKVTLSCLFTNGENKSIPKLKKEKTK